MEKIIQFFNFSLPCPAEIKDCEALRQEYTSGLEAAKRGGGCPPCVERNFKNNYIVKLQNIMSQPPL